MKDRKSYLLGVDVGGTFVDLVLYRRGGVVGWKKVPSAAADDSDTVAIGVRALLREHDAAPDQVRHVVHGATVATNAVLQLKGSRTALLTTKGFEDVLELRRIRYPERYNPFWRKPPPLVPRRLRKGVSERLDASGQVITPIDLEEVRGILLRLVREERIESVAVCLLHSHVNPVHEEQIALLLSAEFPELRSSISSRLVPFAGEYERTSTVVCDAYVKPVVASYQGRLLQSLRGQNLEAPLMIMQSNGGMMSARLSAERPVFGLESGPAAGVMAAAALARLLGENHVVAFDMGGTTAKASIVERGEPSRTTEYEIGARASMGSRLLKGGGYLLKVRSVDVAEVGAGGGSIISIDSASGLAVGPESAGAVPGPVCYGHGGEEPTVTDANVLLGYLNPGGLLGGALPVHRQLAREVWEDRISSRLGATLEHSAYGAHLLANASMERAIRLVSTERGLDVRNATLIAFGGSGPVHAAQLAASMGIRKVIVPPAPGVFSALGLLTVPFSHEFARGVFGRVEAADASGMERVFQQLEEEARTDLVAAPGMRNHLSFARFADLRYEGSHRELTVRLLAGPITPARLLEMKRSFHRQHQVTFGYQAKDPLNLENLRVVATVQGGAIPIVRMLAGLKTAEQDGSRSRRRRAYFGDAYGWEDAEVVSRGMLKNGPLEGPFIVEEYDTTVVGPPGFTGRLDEFGNIVLQGRGGVRPRETLGRMANAKVASQGAGL